MFLIASVHVCVSMSASLSVFCGCVCVCVCVSVVLQVCKVVPDFCVLFLTVKEGACPFVNT